MHQDRKRHIENLKREIGLKFGRTIESAADFDLLSITIKQATSETISASTLKRIFGYVKYDAEPSATTLSILSRYVGYAGWSDFCRNYIPSESCDETRLKSIRAKIQRQKRLVSLLVTGCIALTALCIMLAACCPSGQCHGCCFRKLRNTYQRYSNSNRAPGKDKARDSRREIQQNTV